MRSNASRECPQAALQSRGRGGGRLVAPFLRADTVSGGAGECAPRTHHRADVGPSCDVVRGTVESLVREHEVFITDWADANSSPSARGGSTSTPNRLRHGNFPFPRARRPISCARGVSACVPAFTATAILSEDRSHALPRSLVLMPGPFPARTRPKSRVWLSSTTSTGSSTGHPHRPAPISRAQPARQSRLDPARRLHVHAVLPPHQPAHGFVLGGDADAGRGRARSRNFTTNISRTGFLGRILPGYAAPGISAPRFAEGELDWHGRPIDPGAIETVRLVTIEGEKDDICAPGQTSATHALCRNLPDRLKTITSNREWAISGPSAARNTAPAFCRSSSGCSRNPDLAGPPVQVGIPRDAGGDELTRSNAQPKPCSSARRSFSVLASHGRRSQL